MDFVAYHDGTSAGHQAQFNALYPLGYRIISLSVYQPSSPLYAAVWVRRAGPDWSAARHGLTSEQCQAEFDRLVPLGFYPINVQGGGSGADCRFAVVTRGPPPPPQPRQQ